MRVTLSMTSNHYKTNLNTSRTNRDYYSNRALTGRKFQTASENPIGASDAYSLRTQQHRNEDCDTNAGNVASRLKTSESALSSVNTILQNVHEQVLAGINGTKQDFDRNIYAKSLREEAQKSLVTAMNASDGMQYLFGGAKYDQPPFSVGKDGLYYRGVNVNTGKTDAYANVNGTNISFGKDNTAAMMTGSGYKVEITQAALGDANGVTVAAGVITISLKSDATVEDLNKTLKAAGTIDGVDFTQATVEGNYGDPVNFSKTGVTTTVSDSVDMDKLANEKYFIDLGMGLTFNEAGQIDEQSAFNASQSGLDYLGYGFSNDTGKEENAYTVIGKIADILSDSTIPQDELLKRIDPYLKQLENTSDKVLGKITDFGSKTKFVEYVQDRVDTASVDLTKTSDAVEYIDTDIAAYENSMSQYLYSAALRIGTNILQPSFLDFMK